MKASWRTLLRWLVVSLAAVAWLQIVASFAGETWDWRHLALRWGFTWAALIAAYHGLQRWAVPLMLTGGVTAGLALVAAGQRRAAPPTLAGWLVLWSGFSLLLVAGQVLQADRSAGLWMRRVRTVLGHALLAGLAGGGAVLLGQMEARFADEEFFAALQALTLAVYWLLLRGGLARLDPPRLRSNEQAKQTPRGGARVVYSLTAALTLVSALLAILAIRNYQASFSPPLAPTYHPISAEHPFLCGQATPDPQTYQGQATFQRLLDLVAANPFAQSPEYGLLALGTNQAHWAQTFHDRLLEEARQGLFTGPAGSVKSVQHDAALRVYFYWRVQTAFPALFSPEEQALLREWFAAINRRALTVEPVDWMYALAFNQWLQGPYENQENGAGLLALLETTGLADAALSARNRAYLDANRRGWATRFRVSDDAAVYQPEWLNNAYFQALYTGEMPARNMQLSFEWLLLQSLPDGTPLQYNHSGKAPMAAIGLLGAHLTGEGRYLWIAGRSADALQAAGGYVFAQPGLEALDALLGESPNEGSCLLYGDSGLPNQAGPLAPDKIVFRDGWAPDSAYLMLNLRFSGWHRYKATNTVTLVYQAGKLSGDRLSSQPFSWLPTGRSLFRDKRVPRENLNGLVIGRSGLSAVLYALSGVGGRWEQDPPFYARVVRFETGAGRDTSVTEISDWRGWTHRRAIYFYHRGPIVVVDEARGPANSPAAVIWQLPASATLQGSRVTLRDGDQAAEMVLLFQDGLLKSSANTLAVEANGQVSLVTVFLTRQWVGAEALFSGENVELVKGDERITLSLLEERP